MIVLKKRLMGFLLAAMVILSTFSVAFASEAGSTAVTAADINGVITAMTSQISVTTIMTVLVAAIGAAIGFVFMWWGVRKLLATFFSGFRKGKASV